MKRYNFKTSNPFMCDSSEVMCLEPPVHTLHQHSVQHMVLRWPKGVLGFALVRVARHLQSGRRSSQPATGMKLNTPPLPTEVKDKSCDNNNVG